MRKERLDIEYLAVLLDIGYSPAMRDPALRDGYWILSLVAAMPRRDLCGYII